MPKCKICEIKRKKDQEKYEQKIPIKHHNTFNLELFLINRCAHEFRINRGLEHLKKQINRNQNRKDKIDQLKKLKTKLENAKKIMKKANGHEICNTCMNNFTKILDEIDYKVLGISNSKFENPNKDSYLTNYTL